MLVRLRWCPTNHNEQAWALIGAGFCVIKRFRFILFFSFNLFVYFKIKISGEGRGDLDPLDTPLWSTVGPPWRKRKSSRLGGTNQMLDFVYCGSANSLFWCSTQNNSTNILVRLSISTSWQMVLEHRQEVTWQWWCLLFSKPHGRVFHASSWARPCRWGFPRVPEKAQKRLQGPGGISEEKTHFQTQFKVGEVVVSFLIAHNRDEANRIVLKLLGRCKIGISVANSTFITIQTT